MPVTVILRERSVKLTEETKPIFDAYVKALEDTGLYVNATAGVKPLAAPGEVRLRDSFWAKHVTATLEKITSAPRGAQEAILGAEQLDLEVPSELLLSSYNGFLNDLLLAQEVKVDRAERSEISSKFILVRELLYRLVAIALSNKLDKQNDGDNMLKCLRDFLTKITETKRLTVKPFLSDPKNSHFLNQLMLAHPKWMDQIEQMVRIVKLIHQNTQAIQGTLNYLKQVEYAVQRQLIAFLDPDKKPVGLSIDWVEKTLSECEQSKIKKGSSSSALVVHEQHLTQTQVAVLEGLPRKISEKRREKITQLYSLLNRTYAYYEMMGQLDLLMTYAGWMPILIGLVNFQKVGNLIKNHSIHTKNVLNLHGEPEFESILKSPMGTGLAQYQAVTVEHLGYMAVESISDLNALQDNTLKERVGRLMSGTLASLVRFQKVLPRDEHFIDTSRIPTSINLLEELEVSQLESQNKSLKSEKAGLQRSLEYTQSQSADQKAQDRLLHTLLANQCQDIKTLTILKEAGADLTSCYFETGFYGYTALHIAACTNNKIACEWIISQGINVNILDAQQKKTALSVASKRKCTDVVRYLEKLPGANVQIINELNHEIHKIVSNQHITEKDDTVSQSDIDSLSEIVLEGGNVNSIIDEGSSKGLRPLHVVLLTGNQKLASHLISLGADPKLKDDINKETPYEMLCRVKPLHMNATQNFIKEIYSQKFLETDNHQPKPPITTQFNNLNRNNNNINQSAMVNVANNNRQNQAKSSPFFNIFGNNQ